VFINYQLHSISKHNSYVIAWDSPGSIDSIMQILLNLDYFEAFKVSVELQAHNRAKRHLKRTFRFNLRSIWMRVKLAGELAKLVEDDIIIILKDEQKVLHQLNHQWLEAPLLSKDMHNPTANATVDDNPTRNVPRIMYIHRLHFLT
jgi:hypothetical protein